MKIDRQSCSGVKFFPHFDIIFLLLGLLVGTEAIAQIPRAEASRSNVGASYLLSANDLIKMSVFEENDLETTVRISSDGTVTFPLIGVVKVAGKTPQGAAGIVRELYAKDYLVNPQVNLVVMEYSKRRFIILGQVQRPGTFDMPDRDSVSLLQAVGMAGGYTRIGDPAKITVKRNSNGKETVLKVNGKRMASGEENVNFEVQPGDIITVGESLF
jgi:polysaccharide export outer membrane protein